MPRLVALILVGALLTAVPNCSNDDIVVGRCGPYTDVEGTAEILSLLAADPDANNCPRDPITVLFVFTPDDPSAHDDYLHPQWSDTSHLTVGDGKNPNLGWTIGEDLVQDSIHACVRSELTWGVCTPVIFRFPDVDFGKWSDSCFGP